MRRALPLDEITAADAPRVGGKAYGCARLRQAGFPVPDGIALGREAMSAAGGARRSSDTWLAHLPEGARLAVRSSAADEDGAGHSFAGIHDTWLNVRPDAVPEAVRACWASVTAPRALAYRQTQGLQVDGIRGGVLVQLMVDPVASGVAFTVNPVTGNRDEMVISAAWGLGEAVVAGHVQPDEFVVAKRDGAVQSTSIGDKRHRVLSEAGVSRLVETDARERAAPSLSDAQLAELAALLLRIETAPRRAAGHRVVPRRPALLDRTVAPGDDGCHPGGNAIPSGRAPTCAKRYPTCPHRRHSRRSATSWTARRTTSSDDWRGRWPRSVRVNKSFFGRRYFNVEHLRHYARIAGREAGGRAAQPGPRR